MEQKRLLYESLLNQHRTISNQISEIKSRNFELTAEDKNEIVKLERRLIEIMNQMKSLF
jgi:Ser/Thr protein kinase RdoA (MazF antagonist)